MPQHSERDSAVGSRLAGWLGVGLVVGSRAIAALISLVIVLGSGYAWATYRSFTANVTHVDAIDPSAPDARAPDLDGKAENILLVGDDHRPANASAALLAELSTQLDGGGTNTDTMMVMHVPADGSKATLISFPRDSWVKVPGHGLNKLNAAFSLGSRNGGGDRGGSRLLIATIHDLTGLHIDHFVRVSLVGFYQIAKVLGPIPVCLKHASVDPYSGTDLPAGPSDLTPKQALSFVRQRHDLLGGDLGREIRQQYFLSQAFSQIASAKTLLNPLKLRDLLSAVSSNIETDFAGDGLLKFAQQMENLQSGNLKSATIPTTGTPTIYVDGAPVSIVAVDRAAIPSFIAAVVGPSAPAPKSATPAVKPSATPAPGAAHDPAATHRPTPTVTPPRSYSSTDCIN
ncbi:LytR family transcriptional attenuator [Jatrophihabitans sp. GAS493]|uniref:LCP family protein n=1 Tax=Jatrophihabitans sp. GAS493 TaxID=1907575 RepID=UPI000BB88282|nr:LCP family protein [Jatrophihabitans sp. GAS493]SOD71483.1 LytR family transcriptional attenuator [Jatrophihabitans sp. GAS493]